MTGNIRAMAPQLVLLCVRSTGPTVGMTAASSDSTLATQLSDILRLRSQGTAGQIGGSGIVGNGESGEGNAYGRGIVTGPGTAGGQMDSSAAAHGK